MDWHVSLPKSISSSGVTNIQVVLALCCVIATCALDAVNRYTEPPFVQGWASRRREVDSAVIGKQALFISSELFNGYSLKRKHPSSSVGVAFIRRLVYVVSSPFVLGFGASLI